MDFSWSDDKNHENIKKHGIDFKEASEIFDDPLHISVLDKRFDYFDERWISIGATRKGRVVVTGHLYRITSDGEHIRIVTARKATKKEKKQYETTGRQRKI